MSISQAGKIIDPSKYSMDFDNKIFSSEESHLVFDFHSTDGWTFNTGDNCTFEADGSCTFKAGDYGIFKAGRNCTFKTGRGCTFDTESECAFLILDINSHTFKRFDGTSTILDRGTDERYVLNKALLDMIKVSNG